MSIEARAADFRTKVESLRAEIARVIVGHDEVVRQVLLALLAGGHALLEGVPGLGKTLLVRTLAEALRLEFRRIQFTPDLMPADITGTHIVQEEGDRRVFQFQKGPVFAQILLADEINRATPKTQSALLEAMQERAVTVAGTRFPLPDPFFVLATQNPIEMEGTYPLPEAQVDRFLFKIRVETPSTTDLVEVIRRTTGRPPEPPQPVLTGPEILDLRALAREVPIASHIEEYVARLIRATHPGTPEAVATVKRYVRYGASPRGAQAIVLAAKVSALAAGRYHVSFPDVKACAAPALRHRVILNFEGEAQGIRPDDVVKAALEETPEVPGSVEKMLAR